jgi:hypothetical protein
MRNERGYRKHGFYQAAKHRSVRVFRVIMAAKRQ